MHAYSPAPYIDRYESHNSFKSDLPSSGSCMDSPSHTRCASRQSNLSNSSDSPERDRDMEHFGGSGSPFALGRDVEPFDPLRGWRVILLGSYLNVLLVLIPVSWILELTMPQSHALLFAFCIMSLLPLVKLHDLATRELALRIGGSKTGLLNASLNNTVELVVAIIALRKCELRVVQSSLIGAILSRLLLVLGMCFFAGGLRFSEQDFNPTATQVHSSLLSISVGALLLPAAYHFSLSSNRGSDSDIDANGMTNWQRDSILRMSHGVSIVLLFIYISYLVFQLWSHEHLYRDLDMSSSRLSSNFRRRKATFENLSRSSWIPARNNPYLFLPCSSPSEHTLAESMKGSTDIATPPPSVGPIARKNVVREGSSMHLNGMHVRPQDENPVSMQEEPLTLLRESHIQTTKHCVRPQLSWVMTLLLLVIVTILVALDAEWLVESMDRMSPTIRKEWVALILLPAVSAVAECATAVNVSVEDQLTLSVSVAVGSTIQTALFVIPFMVTLAWVMHKPLALLFDPFESVILYISVHIMNYVVADGKSNWLEGIILICLYCIIAIASWFYPGSNLASNLAVCSTS